MNTQLHDAPNTNQKVLEDATLRVNGFKVNKEDITKIRDLL